MNMTNIGQPLAHVAAIPSYPPGRAADAVAREFGLDPASVIKLASNENPLGCSAAVTEAIIKLASGPNIYPDFDSYDLRHVIADHVGLHADQVLPGEGSSEIILLAARAYLDSSRAAIIPQYSFQSYEGAVRSVAGQIISVPAKDYGVDLDAVLAAVTDDTQIVFLATPNNPTGTSVPRQALERFVDRLPENVLLVLDEAYREFVPASERPDVNSMLARRRNLLVLRTFSKLYGLAGLRVGYALGDPELLQMLRRLQLPFSVSSVAQAAAVAALGDADFAKQACDLNTRERAKLEKAFEERNLERVPSHGNFVLVRVSDGLAVTRAMMARGVIVRPVANYGLPEWLRVSVGLPQENDRFLSVLDEVLAASPTLTHFRIAR
jgi:histidinol-phosphate aminotransferase